MLNEWQAGLSQNAGSSKISLSKSGLMTNQSFKGVDPVRRMEAFRRKESGKKQRIGSWLDVGWLMGWRTRKRREDA
jgi:hypothetical protein